MKINRNNYMLYFLDYYEGALSAEQQKELMQFLDDHADLKAEFNDFEMIQLQADNDLEFTDKFSLKKAVTSEDSPSPADVKALHTDEPKSKIQEQDAGTSPFLLHKEPIPVNFEITPENYEEVFAAYVEGDLTDDQMLAVETFAASKAFYQRELDMIKAARLEPEAGIEYQPKSALKKYFIGQVTRALRQYGSAAAAILLLAVFVFSLLPLTDSDRIAQETPVAGDQEVPEAVAVTPDPQQDILKELAATEHIPVNALASAETPVLESINGRDAIAEMQARKQHTITQSPSYISSQLEINLTGFRREPLTRQLQPAQRMEAMPVATLVASAHKHPATIETNLDNIWLAYRDASELYWLDDNDYLAVAQHDQEPGLAGQAISILNRASGIDTGIIEEVISGDSNVLRDFANTSIGKLAPTGINMLGIESRRDKNGRLVYVSVGQVFSIQR